MIALLCSVLALQPQTDTAVSVRKGALEVSVHTSDMVTTSNPLTVYVELTNHSSDRSLRIHSLSVELPRALLFGARQPVQLLIDSMRTDSLGPGETTSRSTTFEATAFHQHPIASLGYRCGNHQVRVQAVYSLVGATAVATASGALTTLMQVGVQPRAGLPAVIVGGIIGVLLASLLSILHRRLKAHAGQRQAAEGSTAGGISVSTEALTVLYGILVTAAGIYLLQATTVPGFPVSVSLCDPLGGLILGLFFRPVGQFIQGKVS